jgi:hypothetical protein
MIDDMGTDWDKVAAEADAKAKVQSTNAVSSVEADPTATPSGEGRGFVEDVLVSGLAGGVEQAGRGVYSTVKGVAELAGAKLPDLGDPLIDKPEGIAASITRDVTQFGLGFVGGMGLLKVTGVAAKLAPVAKEIVASGVGTGIVADPTADRLSNLIQKYPALENPVTEFLATNEDDGIAMSKLKASLEDMMTTPVAMVMMKALTGVKHAIKGDKAALDVADEVAADLAKASVRPNAPTSGTIELTPGLKPQDADLFKAFPGSKTADNVTMANVDEIKLGHSLDTPEGKASVDKYVKLFKDDPSKVPAIIREKLEDGTFSTPSGNGRLQAAKQLGIKQIPVVDFQSAASLKAEAQRISESTIIKTQSGKVAFTLSKDEAKAFDAHVNYMVSNDRLEDVFQFPAFSAFNAKNTDALPETKEVVQAMSDFLAPKLQKLQGGVRTHVETDRLADLVGTNPKQVYANLQAAFQGTKNLDVTITAAKGLIYSKARELRGLATRIRHEVSTDVDHANAARLEDELTDLIGMTQAVRKEGARGTSAGRVKTGEKQLDEMITLFSMVKDEKELVTLVKGKSYLGKLLDAHNEFWINGILSGVKTHVVNMTSAATNTLLQPMNQIIGGAITRNKAEMAEGLAIYRGIRRHVFDSFEMAARAFKSGDAILDPGKSSDEIVKKAISSEALGGGRWVDWLGTVARIPGRFLKAEDEFFKQMNYRAKVEANAAREAANLVQAQKLDPAKMVDWTDGKGTTKISEVEKYIREKFNASFNVDQIGINKDAINYSREITFTQDLNDMKVYDWMGTRSPAARLQEFASGHPLLRGTVLPFIKVPTNLMRAMGDFTPPIALLKKEGMDILRGVNTDPHDKAMYLGRLTTGTALWMGAGLLAVEGRITGSAYGDKEMRARQMESGWQPYSIKIEGKDGTARYVSYQRLDPYGAFFGLAADMAYLSQHIDEDSKNNLATAMALALSKNIASKSYLQGIIEMSTMIGSGVSAEEQVERMIQMRAASYIPQYANLYTGNDELKEVRSIMDAMMAKIPGLSEQVEAKRDYFGEKRMAPMGYPWNAVDPFPISQDKDAVRTELARLSRSQAETRFTTPDTKLGSLDLTQIRNAAGQTAYDRWTELIGTTTMGGKTFHEKLNEVIQSDRYKAGNDGTSVYKEGSRPTMLKRWQEKYREKALHELLKDFKLDSGEDLREVVRADKRNKKDVKRGRVDEIRDLLSLSN